MVRKRLDELLTVQHCISVSPLIQNHYWAVYQPCTVVWEPLIPLEATNLFIKTPKLRHTSRYQSEIRHDILREILLPALEFLIKRNDRW